MDTKAKILARLEEVQRHCDGDDTVIGRFTDKCYYDERLHRVYCSTTGCTEYIRQHGNCITCDRQINPFEEDISEVETGRYVHTVCPSTDVAAAVATPTENVGEEVVGKRKRGRPPKVRTETEIVQRATDEGLASSDEGEPSPAEPKKRGRPARKTLGVREESVGSKVITGTELDIPPAGIFQLTLAEIIRQGNFKVIQQLYVCQVVDKETNTVVATAGNAEAAFKRCAAHALKQ